MAAHGPCGLSFRALTILIEHIENNGDWPIIHINNDVARNVCTTALISRGFLRPRNSKFTTITRHGHDQFCKAAGAWAEFLERLELKRQDEKAVAALANDLYIQAHVNEENKIDITVVACGQGGTLAHHESTTLPPKCANA